MNPQAFALSLGGIGALIASRVSPLFPTLFPSISKKGKQTGDFSRREWNFNDGDLLEATGEEGAGTQIQEEGNKLSLPVQAQEISPSPEDKVIQTQLQPELISPTASETVSRALPGPIEYIPLQREGEESKRARRETSTSSFSSLIEKKLLGLEGIFKEKGEGIVRQMDTSRGIGRDYEAPWIDLHEYKRPSFSYRPDSPSFQMPLPSTYTPRTWNSEEWSLFYTRLAEEIKSAVAPKLSEIPSLPEKIFFSKNGNRVSLKGIANNCPSWLCGRTSSSAKGTSMIEAFRKSIDPNKNFFYGRKEWEKSQSEDTVVKKDVWLFNWKIGTDHHKGTYYYSSDGGQEFYEASAYDAKVADFRLTQLTPDQLIKGQHLEERRRPGNYLFVNNLTHLFRSYGEITFSLRRGTFCDSLRFSEGGVFDNYALLPEGLERFRVGIYGKRKGTLNKRREWTQPWGVCSLGGCVGGTQHNTDEKSSTPYMCNFMEGAREMFRDVFPKEKVGQWYWDWKKVEQQDRSSLFALFKIQNLKSGAWKNKGKWMGVPVQEELAKIEKILSSWTDSQWKDFLKEETPFLTPSVREDWIEINNILFDLEVKATHRARFMNI